MVWWIFVIIFVLEYTGSMLLISIVLSGHVDFVLYSEDIQVQYNVYIRDHLYLKTMLFCVFVVSKNKYLMHK